MKIPKRCRPRAKEHPSRRGASLMSYEPGLVVWYVDETYGDNWTGVHPGDGFLGVVDSDLNILLLAAINLLQYHVSKCMMLHSV